MRWKEYIPGKQARQGENEKKCVLISLFSMTVKSGHHKFQKMERRQTRILSLSGNMFPYYFRNLLPYLTSTRRSAR